MIARLRGAPAGRTADGLVLDVGGVGYLVSATPTVLRARRERAERSLSRRTCTSARTRSSCTGSPTPTERALFVQLLGVSGIGPKVALAVVSGSTPDELRRAIALEDTARFQAIPGIGKKTAERIVLELQRRSSSGDGAGPGGGARDELVARDALVELGYSLVEAEQALAGVDPELPAEERVRQALRSAA